MLLNVILTGFRPHPNECSGSDLDGDIYFVSWDPDLIPSRQIPPMEYVPAAAEILDHDVQIEVLLQLIELACKAFFYVHWLRISLVLIFVSSMQLIDKF